MRVFKTFLKVLSKKLHSAIIYFVVFMAIGIVMTYNNDYHMFEQTKLKICIFDEDDTPESKLLCDFIAADNTIVELENDRDVLIDALYYERANFILTIRKGYAENLTAGNTQDLFESQHMHDSYSTVCTEQLLDKYVNTVSAYMAGGKSVSEAIEAAQAALSQEAEVTMARFDENGASFVNESLIFFFRYLPYILIAIVMNSLCPVLMVMNKKDIRYRTNCSGIRSASYTMELFAGGVFYLLVLWLAFMIVGMIINSGIYEGYSWIAVLNSFIFSLFSVSLTVFVSSFDLGYNMINVITQVVSLGMSFLCGIFVDQSMLGDGVLTVARFLPAYWYVKVCRMLEGTEQLEVDKVIISISIEAAFAVVMAILTVLVRKMKYSAASANTPIKV